jgi:hypothetical protein
MQTEYRARAPVGPNLQSTSNLVAWFSHSLRHSDLIASAGSREYVTAQVQSDLKTP